MQMKFVFKGFLLLFILVYGSLAKGQEAAKMETGQYGEAKKKKISLNYLSLAFTNNHTAFPFSSFSQLVAGEWHPGFEAGTGFNWSEKRKHDWFQDFRIGYFYHQFVQHGIPLYTSFGYRYKFSERWNAQAGIGAGYFHSIPDQQRFKLNENGDYEKLGGIGRGQAMIVFNLSAGYRFNLEKQRPLEVFTTYQQRIQTPFVPSYVPLLPYNTLMIGVKRQIRK
jgi:hypothetical protein